MSQFDKFNLALCAYAPNKEAWKLRGNFYTSEELRHIHDTDDMTIHQPLDSVLSAD